MGTNTKILIIHPSEIIQKGLSACLISISNIEIYSLFTPEELEKISTLEDDYILIFTTTTYKTEIFNHIFNKNNIDIIWLSDEKSDLNSDLTINIETRSSEIIKLTNTLIQKKKFSFGKEEDLTEREVDVLRQVSQGYSNKEIADNLFISTHTVITHRKNITQKLGIKSISGLTVYAILNNIIDPDSMESLI